MKLLVKMFSCTYQGMKLAEKTKRHLISGPASCSYLDDVTYVLRPFGIENDAHGARNENQYQ